MNDIIINEKSIFPSKVVCIGRNYVEHIKELKNDVPDEMVFFIKPNSSISRELIFPRFNKSCHYEAEISFLIEENKISAVGFGLDLTLRDVQSKLKSKGLPWERAKSFRSSAVFSKFQTISSDISDLGLELYINNELRQKGDVSMMINKPNDIINEFQTFANFEDGDILMSGTPSGVGEINIGDELKGVITLKNKVVLETIFVCI